MYFSATVPTAAMGEKNKYFPENSYKFAYISEKKCGRSMKIFKTQMNDDKTVWLTWAAIRYLPAALIFAQHPSIKTPDESEVIGHSRFALEQAANTQLYPPPNRGNTSTFMLRKGGEIQVEARRAVNYNQAGFEWKQRLQIPFF